MDASMDASMELRIASGGSRPGFAASHSASATQHRVHEPSPRAPRWSSVAKKADARIFQWPSFCPASDSPASNDSSDESAAFFFAHLEGIPRSSTSTHSPALARDALRVAGPGDHGVALHRRWPDKRYRLFARDGDRFDFVGNSARRPGADQLRAIYAETTRHRVYDGS